MIKGLISAGLILTSIMFAVAVLLLAACSVGPDYVRPSAQVPSAYKELGAPNAVVNWKVAQPKDDAPRGKWWESFNDGVLNGLEEKLNVSNQNIAAAAANVQAAQAIVREAQAQFFPTVSANPSITRERTSFSPSAPSAEFTAYSLPLQASWEPDLWGRVRSTVASSRFAAQASEADLQSMRLSEQAELAADYYALRAQDRQIQLLDATVKAYQETLELANDQYIGGTGTDEAVAQAETQLKTAQAQGTNLGVLRAQYEHAIALLTGQPASIFTLPAAITKENPPAIPVGVPSDLLERRPDIAAAERSVAQANAQIGVAKSAFFPDVTLGGTAGFESFSMAKWLSLPSLIWSVGPSLAQTIFDGELRKATVQQSEASYNQTVANYRQTVLTAFQQVEDNLSTLRILAQVINQQDAAVTAAQRSLDEATARYKAGLDPYLNVITAQTAMLTCQQAAVSFRMQQMVASVQLIKSLGGAGNIPHISN